MGEAEMICSKCGNDMKVRGGRYEVSGDKSAQTQTKVTYIMTLECVNQSCPERGKTIEIAQDVKLGT